MLTIKDLNVKYKKSTYKALNNINFSIDKGQLVVIAGPSGCGKSTLAQAILGLIPFFIDADKEGEIYIENEEITKIDRKAFLEKIGYIPQYPSDFTTSLLVEEEIAFPLENFKVPQETIKTKIVSVMQNLDIIHLRDRLITEISSGELQKVSLATAMAHTPTILILDEPMARIDPQTEVKLVSILRKLADQGHLILAFEHRLDYLLNAADRLIVMDKGEIIGDGTPHEEWRKLSQIDLPEILEIQKIEQSESLISFEDAKNHLLSQTKTLENHSIKVKSHLNIDVENEKLHIKELNFRYKSNKITVFEDLDLDMCFGKSIGLVGSNGSGKSTLLRLISGNLKYKKGKILYNETQIKGIRTTKGKVLLLPENAKLFLLGPTPRQDLMRVLNDEAGVDEIFSKNKLSHLADKKLYHMSEGERRLVSILIMFQFPQKIILLDEPTIGLDKTGRSLLFTLISNAIKQKKLVVIASNDPRIFSKMDELIVLGEKKVLLYGKPRDVLYELELRTKIYPNQIVRLIKAVNEENEIELPNLLTAEEVNSMFFKEGDTTVNND